MATTTFASVSAYIAAQPKSSQPTLKKVRAAIRKGLPGAAEVVSYGMPAYKLNSRGVIAFAGWKEHYSIYPASKEMVAAFRKELAPYEFNDKGTIRFPLSEPVPAKLLENLARFRAKQALPKARRMSR